MGTSCLHIQDIHTKEVWATYILQMEAEVSFETLANIPADPVSYIGPDSSSLVTLAEDSSGVPGEGGFKPPPSNS